MSSSPLDWKRAKQAQRFAEIGYKGEIFVLNMESERLSQIGLKSADYPRHVAMESSSFGYDILSVDQNNEEIFIEVKSTTRIKDDNYSRHFHLSLNEYDKCTKHHSQFKLYRVYDIEGNTSVEIVDLNSAVKTPDGYIITF